MKNMETPTTRQRKPVKTENDSMSIPQGSEDISLEDGNEPLLTKDSKRNLNGEQTSGLSASKPSDGDDKSTTLSSPTANSGWATVKIILGESYTSYLLPFVFLGIIAGRQHWDDSLVFLLNFLAILPLASLLSFATEELAKSVGQLLGGLINATFGNAVEMIVRSLESTAQRLSRNLTHIIVLMPGRNYCCRSWRNEHRPVEYGWKYSLWESFGK